jgi:aspartate/methionine/tyrosine aminotransferase
MIIQPATRTLSVKEYYFSVKNKEMARLNAQRAQAGLDSIINLGIGSPDGTPPVEALQTVALEAVRDGVHGYQSYTGIPELRKAFAAWYRRYYNVELDPSCEIQPLTGSKEGILIISLTFLNEGDRVLVPDPGYPTYTSASQMVQAEVVKYSLTEQNGWYPDFDALEKMDLTGVKMMWTNYPGMPTGAQATKDLYRKIVDFGRRHGILIVNDNPYSFIRTKEHLSILEVPGAKEGCLEMNSLSKAHNMAGWRLGMVAGQADYIKEILKVKSQMDSGIFRPLQLAAVKALEAGEDWFEKLNAEYYRRAEVAYRIMDTIGATYDRNAAGLFVWGRLPDGLKGADVSDRLLYDAGVFITPGFIFGKNGENYIRISLCANVDTLERALEKIKSL